MTLPSSMVDHGGPWSNRGRGGMGGKACLVIPYDANGKNYEGAGGGMQPFSK